MAGGLYTINTRSTGEVITFSKYNADHQLHVDNSIPAKIDDYSETNSQMQSTEDPYPASAISKATSLAGEILRLRYQLDLIIGGTYWYEDPPNSLTNISNINEDQVSLMAEFSF